MQTYLFYDIETTGLNKCFDQVLQFAAIRTDLNLQEIERHEFKIKLNPDTVPSPYALITHHISVKETPQDLNEFVAIKKIHALLNEPETISIGYNTLGFDDEFLRFSFYRNLLPPYTHQYANNCSRMDLYPIAAMYYLFKNELLKWPSLEGTPTLKLEYINAENNLVKGKSHDAMVDVEVTLALAKIFFKAQDMWKYVTSYFDKKIDKERFLQLPESFKTPETALPEALFVEGIFGANQNFICPAIFLGEHFYYKNLSLWLRLDTENLSLTTDETIAENTWVIRKKWGEPGLCLPPKERFMQALSAKRQTLLAQNKLWLLEHPELLKKIISYHRNFRYPEQPNADIQARLYLNGFWSAEEENACRRFHQLNAKDKSLLVETLKNNQLRTLALRILGRNYSDELTENQSQQFAQYFQKIKSSQDDIIDFRGEKRLTPAVALQDILELRKKELTQVQHELLNELEIYLNANFIPMI
ncbi:MAG: exonuclease domain-containing protein [Gammaproteobacteria bacterium]|nr:exonuclease domain-containing protein [Gammaproteobacteria bacterium]